MAQTELDEIKAYWKEKYPYVSITLYSIPDKSDYRGKIMTHNDSVDLCAQSVGELINQGEQFLRKINK